MLCPRCGAVVVRKPGRGRPPLWCSHACRQAASLERQTSKEPVRVVEVVRERPPSIQQAVSMVLDSPKAVENVLKGLLTAAEDQAVPTHASDRLAGLAAQVAATLRTPGRRERDIHLGPQM